MSSKWLEDPELARLRDSAAGDARKEQQEADKIKRDQDAFMSRYQALISGGFAQAADVLRASGKYGNPTVEVPKTWRPYNWEIRGEQWSEPTTLLYLTVNAGAVHISGEHLPLENFSEQWFREILRTTVSKLVS